MRDEHAVGVLPPGRIVGGQEGGRILVERHEEPHVRGAAGGGHVQRRTDAPVPDGGPLRRLARDHLFAAGEDLGVVARVNRGPCGPLAAPDRRGGGDGRDEEHDGEAYGHPGGIVSDVTEFNCSAFWLNWRGKHGEVCAPQESRWTTSRPRSSRPSGASSTAR